MATAANRGAIMRIQLGGTVLGTERDRIGRVTGVVVDAGTKRARAVLVDPDLIGGSERLVAVADIARGDDDGVVLKSTEQQTAAESPQLDSEEVAFAQRVEPPTTFIPATGVGGPVYADPPAAPGTYPDDGSFFDIAPVDPPPVEVESNLGPNQVILGLRTEVMSSDNHKLGEVNAVILGDRDVVEGIDVSEGFIFKERSSFDLSDIAEFGTNVVHLRLTRAAAPR
jgi:uncharacterized protein YrrD